uniref:APP_amyloid domain-containing protein n=1 Tax=Angiostrongylus costaricensis TaxID=334426 RepID=A0A158PD71_ANGCS
LFPFIQIPKVALRVTQIFSGFFTPILPTAVSSPRRAVQSKGEWTSIRPVTATQLVTPALTSTISTTITTTTLSTTAPTSATTTTSTFRKTATIVPSIHTIDEPPRLVTMVTKPLGHTTRTVPKTATVLLRPYESVHLATRKNPEYLGESIWASIDLLPEPMGTGLPSRMRMLENTTRSSTVTTTQKFTTTTAQKTQKMWQQVSSLLDLVAFLDKSTAVTFSSFLSATTTKLAKSRTAPSFTVYPVRPTTPMGDLITTTMKTADFPRTALISIASVSVIMIIAVVVFCVFRCRQNPPPTDHYPMTQQGYTSIAPELSPPPPDVSKPMQIVNGSGYQSMKGAGIITNNNVINGHTRNGGVGKKDFKEWYV